MHATARHALTLAILVLCSSVPARAADAPPLGAWAPCAWGSDDCNVCVPDAADAIRRLRDHGDILGFHMNGSPDVDLSHHWQGVQRLMGLGGRYMAVTRNLPGEGTDVSFVIVEMASRDGDGVRFRSNRLDPDWFVQFTAPPTEDRIAVQVPHQAGFTHAGGIQALGNVLAVPFERATEIDPNTGQVITPGESKVVFYDVTNPLAPAPLANVVDHTNFSDEAGSATLGKLADGRFVLVIGRANANTLDFYVSTGTDLRTTGFEHFDTWNEDELRTELCASPPCTCPPLIIGTDCEFGNYQSLNFVTQCDGTLFMIGTHNNLVGGLGDDFVDLFRVENGLGNAVSITKVAKKHVFCSFNGPAHCDLDAAGGAYVDPAGQLYIYGTEHDNDGPAMDGGALIGGPIGPIRIPCIPGPGCSVKFEEFRPIPHNTCSRIQDAWVELYDDFDFTDRSLMIDFVDRNLEDYSNYDRAEGFEDKTSAVRWCIPEGASYLLYEDKESCGGETRELVGTGQLESRSNFFSDETSCSKWLGGPFADAGPDRLGECTSHTTTPMVLDGSASSAVEEGADLTFFWEAPGVSFDDATSATPTGQFPKGTTIATLTVTSGGKTHSDTTEVRIVDTEPPEISCPTALTAECSTAGGSGSDDAVIAAFLEDATVSDLCDPDVGVSTDAPPLLPLGETLVTFTATDDEGLTDSCQATVTVQDTTAPVIDPGFAITPAVLDPPDHELNPMNVSEVVAQEVCDPQPVLQCAVESDEPADAPQNDGNTFFDIVLDGEPIFTQGTGVRTIGSTGAVGEFALALRRERSGVGDGRDYTVSCFGTDASGNVGVISSRIVNVPLRSRKK